AGTLVHDRPAAEEALHAPRAPATTPDEPALRSRAMRRDRHGRLAHADTDERRRPPAGFRVRDPRRFAALVDEAISLLPEPLARELAAAEVVVLDVPDPSALL